MYIYTNMYLNHGLNLPRGACIYRVISLDSLTFLKQHHFKAGEEEGGGGGGGLGTRLHIHTLSETYSEHVTNRCINVCWTLVIRVC